MDPKTKDYMLVLQYAKENLHEYLQTNYVKITWKEKVEMLYQISIGVKRIHDADYTHGDLHSGNILHQENPNNKNYQITDLGRAQPEDNPSNEIYGILLSLWNTNRGKNFIKKSVFYHTGNILIKNEYCSYISDIGLCVNETKVYGVMPYIAPEVLRGKKYTQAADIYSLGMLMYFIATGKQPFYDWPHDQVLAIWVCEGHRPKINEPEAPKCYIDLMKRCWDLNPDNRPKINEIIELAGLFNDSEQQQHNEIGRQLNEAEEYRKENPLSIDVIQSNTHSQAIYTSRLLDIDNNSVEIIDLTESTDQKYE
ncbi:kinase-like protein [Rhizophagus irregularis]|uniref:Kinase-like protein n=1 Tax=Rhizophagus irregularis TaxID=588596 RepID=A0A2N0R761_9GLOM|nr:kinase-like protein [Rhizophagus irregularis]